MQRCICFAREGLVAQLAVLLVNAQVLELRAQFTAARTFFATNKYLQMTADELTELEQQREKERQRIK